MRCHVAAVAAQKNNAIMEGERWTCNAKYGVLVCVHMHAQRGPKTKRLKPNKGIKK